MTLYLSIDGQEQECPEIVDLSFDTEKEVSIYEKKDDGTVINYLSGSVKKLYVDTKYFDKSYSLYMSLYGSISCDLGKIIEIDGLVNANINIIYGEYVTFSSDGSLVSSFKVSGKLYFDLRYVNNVTVYTEFISENCLLTISSAANCVIYKGEYSIPIATVDAGSVKLAVCIEYDRVINISFTEPGNISYKVGDSYYFDLSVCYSLFIDMRNSSNPGKIEISGYIDFNAYIPDTDLSVLHCKASSGEINCIDIEYENKIQIKTNISGGMSFTKNGIKYFDFDLLYNLYFNTKYLNPNCVLSSYYGSYNIYYGDTDDIILSYKGNGVIYADIEQDNIINIKYNGIGGKVSFTKNGIKYFFSDGLYNLYVRTDYMVGPDYQIFEDDVKLYSKSGVLILDYEGYDYLEILRITTIDPYVYVSVDTSQLNITDKDFFKNLTEEKTYKLSESDTYIKYPLYISSTEEIYMSVKTQDGNLLDFEYDGKTVNIKVDDYRGRVIIVLYR